MTSRGVKMIVGIVFIFMGVLIALFPQLLALIVASFLIFSGVIIIATALQFRRTNSLNNTAVIKYLFHS